jgi:hypothetical protein
MWGFMGFQRAHEPDMVAGSDNIVAMDLADDADAPSDQIAPGSADPLAATSATVQGFAHPRREGACTPAVIGGDPHARGGAYRCALECSRSQRARSQRSQRDSVGQPAPWSQDTGPLVVVLCLGI